MKQETREQWRSMDFVEKLKVAGLAVLSAPLVLMIWLMVEGLSFECPSCGSELAGHRTGRCPECSYPFDESGRIQNRLDHIESRLEDNHE